MLVLCFQLTMDERYYYIDRLKAFLICFFIFHQTLIAYGGVGLWYYTSVDRFSGMALIAVNTIKTINLSFLASLFFLISAMFAHESYKRYGFKTFVKKRIMRLGVPLLIYVLVVHPSIVFFVERTHGMTDLGWFSFVLQMLTTRFSFGPFWFIATLLVFELGYALYKLRGPKVESLMTELWQQIAALRTTLFVIGIGLLAFVIRLLSPARATQPGIQWGFYPLYVGMFISGLIAQRNDWIHKLKIGFSIPWLLFAFCCLPLLLASVHFIKDWSVFTGGLNSQSLFYALWEPMLCVGVHFFLMSFFFRYFNKPSERAVQISNLSFLVFFLCPVVIVLFTIIFESLALPLFFKWLFTSVLSAALSYLLAFLLYKIPIMRKIF